MKKITYKFTNVVVNAIPVVFVSDPVNSSIDSGVSDIVVETNNIIDFSVNWNLEIFQVSILLPQTLN